MPRQEREVCLIYDDHYSRIRDLLIETCIFHNVLDPMLIIDLNADERNGLLTVRAEMYLKSYGIRLKSLSNYGRI